MKRYTKYHEWIEYRDSIARVGITSTAESQIGSVILVELPVVGHHIRMGDRVAFLESSDGVFDLLAPASGTIVEVNSRLEDSPNLVNLHPESQGWIYAFRFEDRKEFENLLTASEYEYNYKN